MLEKLRSVTMWIFSVVLVGIFISIKAEDWKPYENSIIGLMVIALIIVVLLSIFIWYKNFSRHQKEETKKRKEESDKRVEEFIQQMEDNRDLFIDAKFAEQHTLILRVSAFVTFLIAGLMAMNLENYPTTQAFVLASALFMLFVSFFIDQLHSDYVKASNEYIKREREKYKALPAENTPTTRETLQRVAETVGNAQAR